MDVDVFLQLIKSLRPRVSIDPVLEIPPQEEVWSPCGCQPMGIVHALILLNIVHQARKSLVPFFKVFDSGRSAVQTLASSCQSGCSNLYTTESDFGKMESKVKWKCVKWNQKLWFFLALHNKNVTLHSFLTTW